MSEWPYSTARWQYLRRLKLRENALCEMCLKQGRLTVTVAVDHIIAINAGGDPFPPLDGLMACCESCHNRKTRVSEQLGKEMTIKGCDVFGNPLDPNRDRFCK